MTLKEKAAALKINVSAVFIAMRKKETPVLAKILAGITVGYALSPIDLIPDFIPVLGYLDDLLILPILMAMTIKLIPKDVMDVCRAQAEGLWKDGKPKRWYYAVPIIVIWAIVIGLIVWAAVK